MFSCSAALMEAEGGVLLATERYGSGETWRYLRKDGAMERRGERSEGQPRGNSLVGAFKVGVKPRDSESQSSARV